MPRNVKESDDEVETKGGELKINVLYRMHHAFELEPKMFSHPEMLHCNGFSTLVQTSRFSHSTLFYNVVFQTL